MKLLDWINIEKINWDVLSLNPNAIELLKENKDKINSLSLAINENPNAIELLLENKDKYYINEPYISSNPNAIDYLKENPNMISWTSLS